MSNTTITREDAAKLVLEQKKVKLMPIPKPGGMFEAGHDGEFMFTGTMLRFVLPYDIRHHKFPAVFKDITEQSAFEALLGVDLNMYNNDKNGFWKRFEIKIIKDDKLMKYGYVLDLNDPMDALKYRVCKHIPQIAPSWAERFDNPSYRLALVMEGEIEEATAKKADNKKRAYLFFGKIENSRQKMIDLLRVLGEAPPKNASVEWLKTSIDNIIDNPNTLPKFLGIIDDENYEFKLFVEDAKECGAIIMKERKYYLPGGDAINPADPTLSGTISILKKYKSETDPIYIRIQTQIDNSKNS